MDLTTVCVHLAFDRERHGAEVEQQADSNIRGPQVGSELGTVNLKQDRYRFKLHDKRTLDK
jgi:hypothetical protein